MTERTSLCLSAASLPLGFVLLLHLSCSPLHALHPAVHLSAPTFSPFHPWESIHFLSMYIGLFKIWMRIWSHKHTHKKKKNLSPFILFSQSFLCRPPLTGVYCTVPSRDHLSTAVTSLSVGLCDGRPPVGGALCLFHYGGLHCFMLPALFGNSYWCYWWCSLSWFQVVFQKGQNIFIWDNTPLSFTIVSSSVDVFVTCSGVSFPVSCPGITDVDEHFFFGYNPSCFDCVLINLPWPW